MPNYQPLHINRTFAASKQAVWDALTQPEKFKQWYMPAPFSVPTCKFDVQPGGLLKIDTQGPDGVIMPVSGEFKVVEEPSKLVMTNSPHDADGSPLFEIQHTMILTDSDGQTELNITSEVLSTGPSADQYLDGLEPGLNQALDQLTNLLTTNFGE